MEKVEKRIYNLFIFVGIVFIIATVIYAKVVLDKSNKLKTTAVITRMTTYNDSDGDEHYRVSVAYNVNGKKYEAILNGYSSTWYIGKEIEIYYDINKPGKITTPELDIMPAYAFAFFGIIFLTIGLTIRIRKNIRKRRLERLKEKYSPVYANYIETRFDDSYAINGQRPYLIICEWNNPEDDKKYILKSDRIWINPNKIIKEKNIKIFPVYINPKNMKEYVVDTKQIIEDVVDLT